jgi:outer membrane protein TolC
MKKFVLLFLLIALAEMSLFSQTLTLEDARHLALANSRSLAKYELSIRSSILNERNQLYSLLPSVSAGYSAGMNYLRNWEFVNPVSTFSTGADFSITQIIFQGGKGLIQKAISSISTESVRKDALAEYFNVIDSADNAYYAVLEARATLEAEEASLQTAVLSYSIAEVRHSTGIINPGDYLKALADKESRENSRNQARRNLALNMMKLNSLMGITGTPVLEQPDFDKYEDALVALSSVSDEQADALYDKLWELVAESNPSFAKAKLNNMMAQKNYSLALTDFSPVISATLFYSDFNYSVENGFRTTGTGGVSLRGSIPVDFWVVSNRIARSKIARDSAALDFIGAEISMETELWSALLNTFAQAGSVLSSRRSLEYTEKHFEYVMELYRLSRNSVSEMSEASSLLINSRNSHIRARYGFLQSLSKLRSLCALDDEEKLLSLLLAN